MAKPDVVRLAVLAIHTDVDRAVKPLAERHAERLQCRRGCADCCVDDIRVFAIEAERIQRHAAAVLRETPHPRGACAFLDAEGACRIYDHRPYVCRTQGLPLRWIDHDQGVEHRDICSLNEAGQPIEDLPAEDCWLLGPIEGRLAQKEVESSGGLTRVALRDLFRSDS